MDRTSIIVAWFCAIFCVFTTQVQRLESADSRAASCPPEKLQTCLNMAYTFLENDRFTFPTTKADVEDVCNSWSKFLDCIEGYVAACLDDRQKDEFKLAVGSILDSVRNLCTDDAYQKQYLQHADCIKRTCTDDAYCGRFYKQMTRQVSQDFDTNDLCCNYMKFNNCVVVNTNTICGSTARDFAAAMLNKAMSFLQARCQTNSRMADPTCIGLQTSADVISISPTAFGQTSGSDNLNPVSGPSSRYLPIASTSATTRWTFTNGPESLAYENASVNLSPTFGLILMVSLLSVFLLRTSV